MMSGQQKISSFFSRVPSAKKRPFKTEVEKQVSTSKVLKQDTSKPISQNSTCSPSAVPTCIFGAIDSKDSRVKSWKDALRAEFNKPYYKQLTNFVGKERAQCTIYPPEDLVFSWMEHCKIRDVKVVILGQDPYHGPKQAHGLCFSVQKGVPPPPSLVNIYKELSSDIKGFTPPNHGDLTGWANQGVLLLNAVLTVRASQANSHKDKGWEIFTDAVVSWLNANLKEVVFILWGSYAQKKGAKINTKRHCVLKGVHPSPLSAHRGFFGCKHFSKANEFLKKEGKKQIDWSDL